VDKILQYLLGNQGNNKNEKLRRRGRLIHGYKDEFHLKILGCISAPITENKLSPKFQTTWDFLLSES